MTLVPSSSHPSSGGGGFTVGSSFLTAHDNTMVAQASGAFPAMTMVIGQGLTPAPTQPDSAGSDLAINALDATKLDVLTTGWYQGTLNAAVSPDTGADVVTGMELIMQPVANTFSAWSIEYAGLVGATDGTTGLVTTPVIKIPAGESIQFFVGVYLSAAHTWSAGAVRAEVMRFA